MGILKQKINEIRKNIKQEVRAELEDMGPKVVYGELAKKSNLDLPMIWFFPAPHTPEPAGANSEQHGFNYYFVALVKNNQGIETGKEEAEDLLARIYDRVTRVDQGNKIRQVCHDVVPGQYNPAYRRADSKRIFWASCEISFVVRRYKTHNC